MAKLGLASLQDTLPLPTCNGDTYCLQTVVHTGSSAKSESHLLSDGWTEQGNEPEGSQATRLRAHSQRGEEGASTSCSELLQWTAPRASSSPNTECQDCTFMQRKLYYPIMSVIASPGVIRRWSHSWDTRRSLLLSPGAPWPLDLMAISIAERQE